MLSVAVMAHPKRERFVDELIKRLDQVDEVVWDRYNDRHDTGRRALLAFDPDASHHAVVQDDGLPCRDFVAGVEELVRFSGEHPVGLYTGRVRPHRHTVTPAYNRAKRLGRPWLAMEGPWWGVGIVLPTSDIPDLVRWYEANPNVHNYDRRISRFYAERGIDCWYTVPSLIEHREVDENPSLVPGRGANRTAHWFIGDDSPLEIDWSLPPATMEATFTDRQGQTRTVDVGTPQYRQLRKSLTWEELCN